MKIIISKTQMEWLMENYKVHQLSHDPGDSDRLIIVLHHIKGELSDLILHTFHTNLGFSGYGEDVGEILWADKATAKRIEMYR